MKRLAILTNGDDASGMNYAICAITRCLLDQGWEVFGVCQDYARPFYPAFRLIPFPEIVAISMYGSSLLVADHCLDAENTKLAGIKLKSE